MMIQHPGCRVQWYTRTPVQIHLGSSQGAGAQGPLSVECVCESRLEYSREDSREYSVSGEWYLLDTGKNTVKSTRTV